MYKFSEALCLQHNLHLDSMDILGPVTFTLSNTKITNSRIFHIDPHGLGIAMGITAPILENVCEIFIPALPRCYALIQHNNKHIQVVGYEIDDQVIALQLDNPKLQVEGILCKPIVSSPLYTYED